MAWSTTDKNWYYRNRDRIAKRRAKRRKERLAQDPSLREKEVAASLAWQSKNRQKVRDTYLRRTYDISLEKYEEMLLVQEGRCAICKEEDGRGELAVDHDHLTGAIRALLCRECNLAVGNTKESPARARALMKYLEDRCGAR